eukprot:GHVP01054420.1.p1 GENE.GHVP01054420.1~~GHVP01054420.1.p1  ORF type:complete len:140 (+),score=27.59 GHVP01054420.1:96-515(+)
MKNLLFFFVALAIRNRNRWSENDWNFLSVAKSLAKCTHPDILEGKKMGIDSFASAEQHCFKNLGCKFFQYNSKSNEVQLCKGNEFLAAEPDENWKIGVKPSTFKIENFKFRMNLEPVCKNLIATETLSSFSLTQFNCIL